MTRVWEKMKLPSEARDCRALRCGLDSAEASRRDTGSRPPQYPRPAGGWHAISPAGRVLIRQRATSLMSADHRLQDPFEKGQILDGIFRSITTGSICERR